MPSFTNNPFSNFYKRILQINQSGNSAPDSTTRNVQGGDGTSTAISLSDDVLQVQPVNGDSVSTLTCKNSGGSNILAVDTNNSKVNVGASQVSATTLFKETGLYDFSPGTTGNHYPLIANTMFAGSDEELTHDADWGDGTDPPEVLDVSALSDPENAIAIYWYLDNNITLDSVRFLATAEASVTLNFHLFAYSMDHSSSFGDLSGGTVHANASVSAISTGIKTGIFTLDEADIDTAKVVIGFAENESGTQDFSVAFNIKYHVR